MKFTYSAFGGALLAPLLAVSQAAFANIDIHFDYRYDSSSFFTGANSSRQNLLEAAASVFEARFQDNLTAITSSGSNKFDASFFRPDNGNKIVISDYNVAVDQIVVFVGSRNMGGTLATGGPGGFSSAGTADFLDNALSRGQPGALLPIETDFGRWGGVLSFNSASSKWYFDSDTSTDEFFSGFDFYSVAVHELAHVLGFGSADSFKNLSSGGLFTGPTVNVLFGSNPSLTKDGHWGSGLSYLGQEAAMDPNIGPGQRKHFTELDYAAMKDIGWQVSPVPEAESWALMLAGLGLLGWRLRAYRRGV
ncbi:MAG: M10 family metallopeptidase domain-containing protein [Pseudomonadota bacterium]|nr:M10 family metallopeptidase domain-containing protein [Pseudomonadota bacterium]